MSPTPHELFLILVCMTASLLTVTCVDLDYQPIAHTNNGKVRGKCVSNMRIAAYLGIPYAKPPTGASRFKKALPLDKWTTTYDATKKPPICMQISNDKLPWLPKGERSEDCLYLNIWSPVNCASSLKGQASKLPVMIWIHGGGYYSGWSGEEFYDGATLAEVGNVIVASLNYRLGSFGFFMSANEDAPGNIGMHDQVLALKWIKDNIASFGGDPNSITLFGESSGSVSVGMHVISPISKPLFQKAIMQSGSPYHPELASPATISVFKSNMFAGLLGCSDAQNNLQNNPKHVVDCMREKDPQELVKTEQVLLSKLPFFFLPTYGDDFMPLNPIAAVNSGNFNRVPILIGNNKDEGTLFLYQLLPEFFNATHAPPLNVVQGKMMIAGLFQNNTKPPPNTVADFYMNDIQENDHEAILRQVHRSFGDNIFVCPSVFFAEKMPDVYFYLYTHRPSNSQWGDWMGVAHFDDIPFVFGLPIKFPQIYTEEEKQFSKETIRKWASFSKYGNPCGGRSSTIWPKYTSYNQCYIELNPRSSKIGHGPHHEACHFWRKYFVSE